MAQKSTNQTDDIAKHGVEDEEAGLPPPTGTLFVMLLFIGAMCLMWGATYWLLVSR